MEKKLNLLWILIVGVSLIAMGCASDDNDNDDNSGSQDNKDTTSESDEDDSETEETVGDACEIDVLETFDTALPTGWTVQSTTGSGSGSGSGSSSADSGNETLTWHHINIDEEDNLPSEVTDNMSGGVMMVGDVVGRTLSETMLTSFYIIGECSGATLQFKQFFDDSLADVAEVWLNVDGSSWEQVATIDTTGYSDDEYDLTELIQGGVAFQLKFLFIDENQMSMRWFIDDVAIIGKE